MDRTKKYRITIILFLMSIAVLIVGVGFIVNRISGQLRKQFEYETGRDLCYEDAMNYHAYCHVRKDDDGSYHWYFVEEEAGNDL